MAMIFTLFLVFFNNNVTLFSEGSLFLADMAVAGQRFQT